MSQACHAAIGAGRPAVATVRSLMDDKWHLILGSAGWVWAVHDESTRVHNVPACRLQHWGQHRSEQQQAQLAEHAAEKFAHVMHSTGLCAVRQAAACRHADRQECARLTGSPVAASASGGAAPVASRATVRLDTQILLLNTLRLPA
jgi:hypothetical protein